MDSLAWRQGWAEIWMLAGRDMMERGESVERGELERELEREVEEVTRSSEVIRKRGREGLM
jgi:hypothetical protein